MRIDYILFLCLLVGFKMNLIECRQKRFSEDPFGASGLVQVISNSSLVCLGELPDSGSDENYSTANDNLTDDFLDILQKLEYYEDFDFKDQEKRRHKRSHKNPRKGSKDKNFNRKRTRNNRNNKYSMHLRDRRTLDVIYSSPNSGCLPPEYFGIRDSLLINEYGFETRLRCCHKRGHAQGGDYIQLCVTCEATTKLTAEYYPREIQETLCLGDLTGNHYDWGCLRHAGTWHGKCMQKQMSQQVVKQQPVSCNLNVDDGRKFNVEEWRWVTIPVRTGCECRINKISLLRSLVRTWT